MVNMLRCQETLLSQDPGTGRPRPLCVRTARVIKNELRPDYGCSLGTGEKALGEWWLIWVLLCLAVVSCDNKTTDNGALLMLGSPRSPLRGFSPDSFVYPACALHLPALSCSRTHSNFLAICLSLISKRLCFALHLPAASHHCSDVLALRQHLFMWSAARSCASHLSARADRQLCFNFKPPLRSVINVRAEPARNEALKGRRPREMEPDWVESRRRRNNKMVEIL